LLDIDKIKQLIEMMVNNDLSEMSLRDGEEEINLRRPGGAAGVPLAQGGPMSASALPSDNPAPVPVAEDGSVRQRDEEEELAEISSPMVGTFYTAPDPDSPPFVEIGSQVQPETVVCVLEAMKVFNEIKSEIAGIVEKILVKNEDSVEYGQPLFLVRPT
jgi:acetyl-CoA carboxylase biotin carboxyl carrier protein